MTALTEFERLEAAGTWRFEPKAQKREVIVSVGDATLVLSDPKSETPLAHWSLPAVRRLNPGKSPALYTPQTVGSEQDELLEIDDKLMIDAIERVHRVIASQRAHPGRLRGGLTLAAIAAMLLTGALWVPGAMVRHAAQIAQPAQAQLIGSQVLSDIERFTGPACARAQGVAVLNHLSRKLLGPGSKITVLPTDLGRARQLPGRRFVVGNDLLAEDLTPATLAGHLLAADVARDDSSVLLDTLHYAGPRAVMSLLTSGNLPARAITDVGQSILSAPAPRPPDEPLLEAFASANLSSVPYARSVDPSGEAVLSLIEADPFRTSTPPAPILTDEQWQALQMICDPV